MRPIPAVAALTALLLVSACGPASPRLKDAAEFKTCRWETVTGGGLAMDGFACGPDLSFTHLVPDPSLPGFFLESGQGPERYRTVAIRTFDKPLNAPVSGALPAIRAASPGRDIETCALVPQPHAPGLPHPRFVLEPTGAAKTAWEASAASDEPQDLPCGPLGVGISGDRFFFLLPERPSTLVFADMGSEIQPFDPRTLRLAR